MSAVWTAVQFTISVVVGWLWWNSAADHPDPRIPVWGALIVGVLAAWLFTFLVTWIRFGWKAARSLRMFE